MSSYIPSNYTHNPLMSNYSNPYHNGQQSKACPQIPNSGSNRNQKLNGAVQQSIYAPTLGNLSFCPNLSISMTPEMLGYAPQNLLGSGYDGEKETVHVYVPKSMVGAIIGKSGSAIREMINNSRASIKVDTSPPQVRTPESASSNNQQTETSTTTLNDSGNSHSDTKSAELSPKCELSVSNGSKSPETVTQPCDNSENSSSKPGPHVLTTNSVATAATPDNDKPSEPSTEKKPAAHHDARARHSQQQGADADYSDYRKVTIVGSPESQYRAQYFVFKKVSSDSELEDFSLLVEVKIPYNLVGKIIGKGGATVKQLQKQTRTTIRFPDDRQQNTTTDSEPSNSASSSSNNTEQANSEAYVQITGTFQSSQKAQMLIRNLVREGQRPTVARQRTKTSIQITGTFRHSQLAQSQIRNLKNSCPKDTSAANLNPYQSYLLNNFGVYTTNSCSPQYNPLISNFSNPYYNGQQSKACPQIPNSGPIRGQKLNGAVQHGLYAPSMGNLPFCPNPNMSMAPDLLGYMPRNLFNINSEDDREVVHVYVPNSMVGAIIGKSGSAIREMINNSGASIKVETSSPQSHTNTDASSLNNQQTASGSQGTTQRHDEKTSEKADSLPNCESSTSSCNKTVEKEAQPCDNSENSSSKSETPVSRTNSDVTTAASDTDKLNETSAENKSASQQDTRYRHPRQQSSTDLDTEYTKVTIVGSPESQYRAQYFVFKKVSSERGERGDVSLLVEMQIPYRLVGKIIGKGGANIQQLQKQTRTTIRLPDERPHINNNNNINITNSTDIEAPNVNTPASTSASLTTTSNNI